MENTSCSNSDQVGLGVTMEAPSGNDIKDCSVDHSKTDSTSEMYSIHSVHSTEFDKSSERGISSCEPANNANQASDQSLEAVSTHVVSLPLNTRTGLPEVTGDGGMPLHEKTADINDQSRCDLNCREDDKNLIASPISSDTNTRPPASVQTERSSLTQNLDSDIAFIGPVTETSCKTSHAVSGLVHSTEEPATKRQKCTDELPHDQKTSVNDGSSPLDVSMVSNLGSDVMEGDTVERDPAYDSRWDNDFSQVPKYITGAFTAFDTGKENFLKGCKWSPDGTCILTNAEDSCLRVFDVPRDMCNLKLDDVAEMPVSLKVIEGELIYDYCWLPTMSSAEPDHCCFASTSRDAPVHLWDAFTGELRASYRAFDHLDELSAAYSIAFDAAATKIYTGHNKMIRVFDVTRPGKECSSRPTFASGSQGRGNRHRVKVGQAGIISCIDVNPADPKMYAAGSYTRSIGIYYEPDGEMGCMFQGQVGGVTSVKFSPDGTKLYSGGRKDSEILCWDMRNPGSVLYILQRDVNTNIRMYFDIDSTGRYVISGNDTGLVYVWDTLASPVQSADNDPAINPHMMYKAHDDCVNGVSLHPTMPVLATGSGQRHFDLPSGIDSDSENEETSQESNESSLKLWWIGKH